MKHRGDTGFTTALGYESISKGSPEVELLGEIEQVDASLQLALVHFQKPKYLTLDPDLSQFLEGYAIPTIRSLPVTFSSREGWKDEILITLDSYLDSLIPYQDQLPSPVFHGPSVYLNLARVQVRRLERRFCCKEQLRIDNNDKIVKLLNRLSTVLWCWAVKIDQAVVSNKEKVEVNK